MSDREEQGAPALVADEADVAPPGVPPPTGRPVTRVLVALALGAVAGAGGAALDVAATLAAGRRVFVVPLLIGVGVGLGVRAGSRGRGGLAYQGLALVLAYLAIAAGHLPLVGLELRDWLAHPVPALVLLATLPIHEDFNGVAGLAMILLGLFQAWRLNRRPWPPARTTTPPRPGPGVGGRPADA